jgi:catechol 2,3-dioxygenase
MTTFHKSPNFYVGQVHLKVEDLRRSVSFYKEYIGFDVLEEFANTAVLTVDGKTPLLTIEQPSEIIPKQRRTTGLYHFALLLPTRKDLGNALNHLLSKKYPLQGGSDHGVSEALYLADPDGNGIELYADKPVDLWEKENGLFVAKGEQLDVVGVMAEAKGELWNRLPNETVMGHIHLHASDLDKTKSFYKEGLGLDLVMKLSNSALFFSTGGYHHHIAINVWNGLGAPIPEKNTVGLSYFTLHMPSEGERSKVLKRCQELGFEVDIKNCSLTDPSGNQIKLVV